MHVGFDVFGAYQFEQVVKFVRLYWQVAVVGEEAVAVADDEAFAAGRARLRVVAAERPCGFDVFQPVHAEVGSEPVGELAVFVAARAVVVA